MKPSYLTPKRAPNEYLRSLALCAKSRSGPDGATAGEVPRSACARRGLAGPGVVGPGGVRGAPWDPPANGRGGSLTGDLGASAWEAGQRRLAVSVGGHENQDDQG